MPSEGGYASGLVWATGSHPEPPGRGREPEGLEGIPTDGGLGQLGLGKGSPMVSDGYDFSGLKAVFINCTLKRSPEPSHTQGLMDVSRRLVEQHGVATEVIRAVDYDIAPGIYPDMREHGAASDDWPELWPRVLGAEILVIGTPIWLGDKSSVCTKVIERLYAQSGETNEVGQYVFYGRVGGCVVTGNEDGIKHCAMNILYSLQHLGYVIPPNSDAGWIGEAGPGPSYLDPGLGGPENDFTNRNVMFMTWNLMHMAQMLKQRGGVPVYGNMISAWREGERFGFEPARSLQQ